MSSVLDQTDLVIKRRPKVFEVRAGYDIYDARAASALASVEQVGRDNLQKLVRPQRDDNARTSLELRERSGPVLVLAHVQAARSSLAVARPDGTEIGLIRLENIFGKSRFSLEVAGVSVGRAAARTWRRKNFAIVDAQGVEVGGVDMLRGTSGDASHDNQYALHIAPGLVDPLRSLAFASAFAVDTILWTR